jgi:hypothetical protein
VAALADGAEGVLQLVDQRNQLFHPAVAHGAGSPGPSAPRSPPAPDLLLNDPAPRRPWPLLPARPGLGATPAPGSASRSPPHPVLRRLPTGATSRLGSGAAPKTLAPPRIGRLGCHSYTQANETKALACR